MRGERGLFYLVAALAQGAHQHPAQLALRAGEGGLRAHRFRAFAGGEARLRAAEVRQRAFGTARARRADRGAEIHYRGIPAPRFAARRQSFGDPLYLRAARFAGRLQIAQYQPPEQPNHVCVDRRGVDTESERQYDCRRKRTDAGQLQQLGFALRYRAAVAGQALLRGAL